jgi:predicted GH43/DUF377 family glycosyl hydrolase
MKIYICFLLLLSIIFYSCSKNTVTSPEDSPKSVGKVLVNIDKVNAPSNVVLINITLTKANADTLTGYMNLTIDSMAVATFQNIAVGTWNLIILAKDISGTVLYKGESEVIVNQGITSNVNLTLTPVGSVTINVNWGPSHQYFFDYSNNPIYTRDATHRFSNGISQSKILLDNGIYKMWYTNLYNSGVSDIWYAASTDGINWNYTDSSVVLTVGPANSWDSYSVCAGAIIKVGSVYYLYYNGVGWNGGPSSIGLATSSDGIHWQKNSNPVLLASQSEVQVGVSGILLKDGKYYLYYTMHKHPNCTISLATSVDGINWDKYPGNPVLQVNQSWEGADIYSASYIYDAGIFTMVYMNKDATGFGLAYSSDGITWQKDNNNPFFVPQNSSKHWASNIAYPDFHKINSGYWIYYTGYTYDVGAIGILKK